ncbi:MAG: hypothetical protein AB7J34_26235 [Limisphaerales bacterium]
MIRKAQILFCDNEHGTGDVCFPDLTTLSGFEFQQKLIEGNSVGAVRRAAKAAGWGKVNGGDYCPDCMESMEAE